MIFLRQKQCNDRRNLSSYHRSRSRTHNQRHLQHLQITRQNLVEITYPHLTWSRRTARQQQIHHDELAQSAALNEKLASIGGLFGAINIIITGALLYSIFTVKPEERWWYIIGVIINIGLLLTLMSSAILFDRYYLKRFDNRSRRPSPNTISNQNRIVETNPTFLPYPQIGRNFPINPIDVPPQYPGYLEESTKIVNEVADSRSFNPNADVNYSVINSQSSCAPNSINKTKNDSESNSNIMPPNYFDLYPKEEQEQNENTSAIPSTSTTTSSAWTQPPV